VEILCQSFFTLFENTFLDAKLSEYHTGYRAFSRSFSRSSRCSKNSDISFSTIRCWAQCVMFGFRIGEVSCPTNYFAEASSINFRRACNMLGVLLTSVQFRLQKIGLGNFRIFIAKAAASNRVSTLATTIPEILTARSPRATTSDRSGG